MAFGGGGGAGVPVLGQLSADPVDGHGPGGGGAERGGAAGGRNFAAAGARCVHPPPAGLRLLEHLLVPAAHPARAQIQQRLDAAPLRLVLRFPL